MSEALVAALSKASTIAAQASRSDLQARIDAAAARVARPQTVVCVVGEFKQGKSLLVNALLGRPVCPVDDDLATSVITVIQHAPKTAVMVTRREHGALVREAITPADLPGFVTEAGNPGNAKGIEQVSVGLDHPLLAAGLAFVDTPGVGGLSAGHAAATMAFLPYADALLFVTDASAEMSRPEVDFLTKASDRCPDVVAVITKTDLYPEWRRLADIDRGHLATHAPGVDLVTVSALAGIEAIAHDDPALLEESGIPALRERIQRQVLDRRRSAAAERSSREATDGLAVIRAAAAEEQRLIDDPEASEAAQQALDAAVAKLEHLRGPGARWAQILSDRMGDLGSQVSFNFRAGVRDLTRSIDERVEELSSPDDWDALSVSLQEEVASLITGLFADVDARTAEVHDELAEVVAIDAGEAVTSSTPDARTEIEEIWASRTRAMEEVSKSKKIGGGAVSALKGAQGGLMMFGLLGRFLPAGAAALLFSNPVTLVLAVAFAGKTATDLRKRNVAARRMQARNAIRQFLDDVSFELTNELADMIRVRQRLLRDEFTERVTELQRTYTTLATDARANATRTEAERAARTRVLAERLAACDAVGAELAAAAATATAAPPPSPAVPARSGAAGAGPP